MNLDLATILGATGADVYRVADNGGLVSNQLSPADLERPFSSLSLDSREIDRDGLFVALKGERVDGHNFVPAALARGAGGAFVSRLPDEPLSLAPRQYLLLVPDPLTALQELARAWRRGHDAEVIGITGSIGKTTTKEIVAAVLSSRLPVLKSHANLNTEIGLPLTLLGLNAHHRAAVLEMGMYDVGDIALLTRIAEPRIGIITNVAPIHLERAGSINRIAKAKSELVAGLPADGVAVLNADNSWTRAMAISSGIARPVLVGMAADSDYRAVDVANRGLDGVTFTVLADGQRIPIQTRVPGTHTIHAFLAAVAVAREFGLDWQTIQEAAEAAQLDVRQRIVRGAGGTLLIDDSYNAAPMSVHAALELLAASPGTKIAVLGDMLELGPQEEESHRQIGERAAEIADWLVVRGPRSAWIAEAAQQRGLPGNRVIATNSNADAVDAVRHIMAPDDGQWAILIKGSRGMAMEEIVQGLEGAQ
jgi:UDP-N-acetylmuramoyl-tripeptide--D-alanyl-D-alanine ligase